MKPRTREKVLKMKPPLLPAAVISHSPIINSADRIRRNARSGRRCRGRLLWGGEIRIDEHSAVARRGIIGAGQRGRRHEMLIVRPVKIPGGRLECGLATPWAVVAGTARASAKGQSLAGKCGGGRKGDEQLL